jgi:hypothetical protein
METALGSKLPQVVGRDTKLTSPLLLRKVAAKESVYAQGVHRGAQGARTPAHGTLRGPKICPFWIKFV